MKLKTLSRLLAFGILINSVPINSFAGTLSEDGRYETFTGNNITVNNILEEDKVDMKIEGNTLVNLANGEYGVAGSSGYMPVSIDNGYSATVTVPGSLVIHKGAILKDNTKYTLICEINTNIKSLSYSFKNNENFAQGKIYENIDYSNGYNKVIKVITTTSNCTDVVIGSHSYSNDVDSYLNIKNLMLFEGDLTDNPPTEYIEGLKSSFEDQLVTQEMIDSGEEKVENLGKYKVEVKSTGKNKFDGNLERGLISSETGEPINDERYIRYRSSNFIRVYKNTKLITSGVPLNTGVNYHKYDINKNHIESIYTQDYILDVDFDGYIKIHGGCDLDTDLDSLDIMIEEGLKVTEYEPYKESVKTFYLNSPLLQGDTIEYVNGQVNHIHRSKEIILNNSENEKWRLGTESTNNNYIRFRTSITESNAKVEIFNDRFLNYASDKLYNGGEMLWIHGQYKTTDIQILKSRLSTPDADGFKEWIKNNPITLVYKLENPIYEPIKTNLSVNLFEGTSHISNNSNITANMEITVDRTINRAVEAIELATVNPTLENISKARMWVNLLDESIKKDELQNEINSITNIEDLQLERKTASANVDVYIKSENMLLMSLSTNSITFDNFSGVEDMELNNAINISINSSLPYQLNSYLLSEIENSDKSNRIEKDLLNIKINKDSDYKTFNDINEKVILEDDCVAGNNKSHSIDLKLKGSQAHKADVYRTVIKFEVEQK